MSDEIGNYLRARLQTDVHPHHAPHRILGGMQCRQVPAIEVVVGDFSYHYSSQLDAFTLFEIIAVDRTTGIAMAVTIDTDSPEVDNEWSHPIQLRNGFDRFYRPDAACRERAEQYGFQSMYEPLFPSLSRNIPRRRLTVYLYYKPAPAKKAMSWFRRFFFKE